MDAMDVLSDLFEADFYAGKLYWKVARSRRLKVGDEAGCLRKDGRTIVHLNGKREYRYRILYAMYHGEWPDEQVDHFDINPSNDCISNLRPVSNTENQHNKGLKATNTTGAIGIHRSRNGKFIAQITRNRHCFHVGTFTTLEEAITARANYERNI